LGGVITKACHQSFPSCGAHVLVNAKLIARAKSATTMLQKVVKYRGELDREEIREREQGESKS
jgi:hypothetical protein